MAKEVIIGMNPEVNHAEGMERIRRHLRNRVTKEQLMEFLQEDMDYIDRFTHEGLVGTIIRKAVDGVLSWEDVVEGFPIDMDDVRVCSECGKPMVVGVYAGDMHYCSDECLDKGFGIERYLEDYDEDGDNYYTEW